MIEAFYNSSRHESTGKTPYEMNGVRWTDTMTLSVRSPMMDGVKVQSAEDLLTDMQRTWEDARRMLLARREKMKAQADLHRTDERYAVGDRVLLSTRRLSSHPSKLDDPFVGPFPVTRVSDHGVNVWLELPRRYERLHQPFHVDKLKRFTPSVVPWVRQQNDRPLPDMVDGSAEYEVEEVLAKRTEEEVVDVQPEGGAIVDDGGRVSAPRLSPPRRLDLHPSQRPPHLPLGITARRSCNEHRKKEEEGETARHPLPGEVEGLRRGGGNVGESGLPQATRPGRHRRVRVPPGGAPRRRGDGGRAASACGQSRRRRLRGAAHRGGDGRGQRRLSDDVDSPSAHGSRRRALLPFAADSPPSPPLDRLPSR